MVVHSSLSWKAGDLSPGTPNHKISGWYTDKSLPLHWCCPSGDILNHIPSAFKFLKNNINSSVKDLIGIFVLLWFNEGCCHVQISCSMFCIATVTAVCKVLFGILKDNAQDGENKEFKMKTFGPFCSYQLLSNYFHPLFFFCTPVKHFA